MVGRFFGDDEGEEFFSPEDEEQCAEDADTEREAERTAEGGVDTAELAGGEVLPDDGRQSGGDA